MPPTGQPTADFSHVSDAELSQMLKGYGVNVGPVNVATRRTYERKLMKLQTGSEPVPKYQTMNDDSDDEDNEEQVATETEQKTKADAATSPRFKTQDNEVGNKAPTKKNNEELLKPKITTNPSPIYQPSSFICNDQGEEVHVIPSEIRSRQVPILSDTTQFPVRRLRETTNFSPRIESRPSLPMHRKINTPSTTSLSKPSSTNLPQEKTIGCPLWLKLATASFALILIYLIYANMEPEAKSTIPAAQNKIEV